VCTCGERLDDTTDGAFRCPDCGNRYALAETGLTALPATPAAERTTT
jgi:tRNA(Ile2) C34 agmatinyltransferase TiaS